MEVSKENAVMYVRSDISLLSEQSEGSEILTFVNRIRAELGLLMTLRVISTDEARALEDEMAKAREVAAARVEQ